MKLRYYLRGLGIGMLVTAVLMSVTIHGKTEKLTDEQIVERAKELGMEEKYDSGVLADTLSENTALQVSVTETEQERNPETEEKPETGAVSQPETQSETETQPGNTSQPETESGERQELSEIQTDDAQTQAGETTSQDDEGTQGGQTDADEQTQAGDKTSQDGGEGGPDDKTASGETTAGEQTASGETDDKVVRITVNGGDGSLTVARKLAQAGLVEDAAAYDRFLCSGGYDKRICTGTHEIPAGASEEEIARIITTRKQ